MDVRRLIKFGNNSFVISLPKNWIVKNKLSKGSLLYLINTETQIIISPQKTKKDGEEKSITLDLRDALFETIRRKIIACYINNYKEIKILFSSNKSAAEIRSIIQNLMALEVIEQGTNVIMAKDYLNMNDIALMNLVRKMDTIIRTMFMDLNQVLSKGQVRDQGELAENFNSRDGDINRLTFLIMRYVKYVLMEPEMKKEGDDYDYLVFYELAQYLERLADELKRAARTVTKEKIKNPNDIIQTFAGIEKLYLNAMKTYYNKDNEAAYKVATEKNPILTSIVDLINAPGSDLGSQRIFEMQRRMVSIISSMLRLVYQ
ncbi:MAG: phosphate uptake regulator PhoU [Nanoarchaeota archaeon]